jgi:hypothetical protein
MAACQRRFLRPRARPFPLKAAAFFLFAAFLFSCGGKQAALFPVRGTNAALTGLSREAAAGVLDFARPKKLEYRFETIPAVPSPGSLEIEYDFSAPPSGAIKDAYQIVLETGGDAWALPMDLAFLGREEIISAESGGAGSSNSGFSNSAFNGGKNVVIHYAAPIGDSFAGRFSISLTPLETGKKQQDPLALPRLQIRSLEIKGRWFGYYQANANSGDAGHCFTSPFVFNRREAGQDEFVIDPPPLFSAAGNGILPELTCALAPGQEAAARAGNRRFAASSGATALRLPSGAFAPDAGPLIISGDRISVFQVHYAAPRPFPEPVPADPGLILSWPAEQWRARRYELFRWEQFPSLLIFDTANYAAQDRLFKRLAFFTEKAGFRGRLASDAEIAGLHGWNAHDYRAEDLARFFEAARISQFPLLAEERELERILLDNGIILQAPDGGFSADAGGVISISRESPDYLRSLFMAHEGFHGLFFIDEDFRAFSRQRWERLPAQAKRFITSYFDYQHYDINDEYLIINEFMAHLLQQPVSRAGVYFGQTLPSRLETSPWRRAALPPKDASAASWPALASAFTAEAEAFSAYVNRRWGLAAGRVYQLTVQQAD